MEKEQRASSSRTIWIVVVVVLAAMCLCALAITAVAYGFLRTARVDLGGSTVEAGLERSFEVGPAPRLDIDNFAGDVTIRLGPDGSIRVIATQKASSQSQLEQIEVTVEEVGGDVHIRTRKPFALSSASVDLEVIAPADTQVSAHTGAGNTEVQGISGPVTLDSGAGDITLVDVPATVEAHTGAGNVRLTGGGGPVRMDTGAGDVEYVGNPQGECRLDTGVGKIELTLPSDASVQLDLSTGVGTIRLDFDVDGSVSRREVKGRIGTGEQGTVVAHTGAGDIELTR